MCRSLFVAAFALSFGTFAAPPEPTPELLAKGKAQFNTTCAPCHGEKGKGDGPAAVALNPKPRDYTKDPLKNGDKPQDVFKTISEGLKDTQMVSFKHLPEEERWALAYYVLELRKAGPAGAATAAAAPDAGAAGGKKAAKAPKK